MSRRVLSILAFAAAVILIVVTVRTLLTVPAGGNSAAPVSDVSDKDIAVAHLSKALSFPTISDKLGSPDVNAAFDDFVGFVERTYPNVHQKIQHERVNGYSSLYTWTGSNPTLPGVLFLAHIDVVPVEPETDGQWTHPAFSGEVADGFIWGRGALDMKAPAVALLEAAEALLAEGAQPKQTIYFAFGHDEETGGEAGAAKIAALLKSRGIRLAYTIDEGSYIADGIVPGVAKPVALIGVAEKGYLSLRLTATATGGHSSMPSHEEAILRVARAVARLEDRQMPASLGNVAPMLDALAPEMPFAQRAAFANRWLFGPVLLYALEGSPSTNALVRTTMAPTIIAGGIKDNVLPREASAVVNFRIQPGDTVNSVREHVRKTIADATIKIEQVGFGNDPLPASSAKAPGFHALESAVHSVFPAAVIAPALVLAGTDTGHYAGLADNSYRFEPVVVTSSDLDRIHGLNERISIDAFVDMIRFYKAVMQQN